LTKKDTAMDWLWIVLQMNICLEIEKKTRSASRRKAKSSGHFSLGSEKRPEISLELVT
jgi:tRNA (Thr-GGU) A37 N-methylase